MKSAKTYGFSYLVKRNVYLFGFEKLAVPNITPSKSGDTSANSIYVTCKLIGNDITQLYSFCRNGKGTHFDVGLSTLKILFKQNF